MNTVWPEIEADAVRQAEARAMLILNPPARGEDPVPFVEAFWGPGDIARAVRYWMRLVEGRHAMLYIPGSETFSDEALRAVGALCGYIIRRTVEEDVLHVEAK